jgi:hypothetical protein
MRSDRLKQVMQEIDSSFDEKNLGISKFSRFCQEAAQRGLLSVTKLDNGQLEVDLPSAAPASATPAIRSETVSVAENGDTLAVAAEDRGPRRSRRGRGGRGRDREEREPRPSRPAQEAVSIEAEQVPEVQRPEQPPERAPEPIARVAPAIDVRSPESTIGSTGERLTRSEAFDLVRRTVADLAPGEETVRASDVRSRARELLGRDSESLSDRMFVRILKDAHDNGIVDLRRRGDDFEVARAVEAAPVSEQVARNDQAAAAAAAPPIPSVPAPRIGMGHRGARRGGGRPGAPPPELLSVGVVEHAAPVAPPAPIEEPVASDNGGPPAPRARGGRGGKAKVASAAKTAAVAIEEPASASDAKPAAKPKAARAAKKPTGRPRAKKVAGAKDK